MHVCTFDQESQRERLHGEHLTNNLRETHKVNTSTLTTNSISWKGIAITATNMEFMIMVEILEMNLQSLVRRALSRWSSCKRSLKWSLRTSKQWLESSFVVASSVIGDTTDNWELSSKAIIRWRLELCVNSTDASTKRTYLVETSVRDLWICWEMVLLFG